MADNHEVSVEEKRRERVYGTAKRSEWSVKESLPMPRRDCN